MRISNFNEYQLCINVCVFSLDWYVLPYDIINYTNVHFSQIISNVFVLWNILYRNCSFYGFNPILVKLIQESLNVAILHVNISFTCIINVLWWKAFACDFHFRDHSCFYIFVFFDLTTTCTFALLKGSCSKIREYNKLYWTHVAFAFLHTLIVRSYVSIFSSSFSLK